MAPVSGWASSPLKEIVAPRLVFQADPIEGIGGRKRTVRKPGDDPPILSLPGVGPATGPCICAYFGDGSRFDSAKKAANYVDITGSNWSSGTMSQSRRAISKEGPAPLRLAFYQAGSVARSMAPQQAAFYYRLMTEHGRSPVGWFAPH